MFHHTAVAAFRTKCYTHTQTRTHTHTVSAGPRTSLKRLEIQYGKSTSGYGYKLETVSSASKSRAKAAVLGAFVADAATMPLHWVGSLVFHLVPVGLSWRSIQYVFVRRFYNAESVASGLAVSAPVHWCAAIHRTYDKGCPKHHIFTADDYLRLQSRVSSSCMSAWATQNMSAYYIISGLSLD